MGGLFSSPKPEVVAPTPSAEATAATPSPDAVASESRTESRDRAQRGRPGTIATSSRGLLDQLPAVSRKSLLGE